jgi:hypothetical protein
LFGPIRTIANDLIGNYESMSLIFRQRTSRGLQMQASYTWAHTLDVSTDSNGGGTPMNPYWWKADYGNSNWDIRHRLLASFIYDIPFFATANPFLKGAFAGWQANGIITIQSGLPFNVSTGTDTANTASSGTYRPNLVKRPPPSADAAISSDASTPPPSRSRTCTPLRRPTTRTVTPVATLLRADGVENVDFSVSRTSRSRSASASSSASKRFGLFNHTIL